jgi:hypothetical protein
LDAIQAAGTALALPTQENVTLGSGLNAVAPAPAPQLTAH